MSDSDLLVEDHDGVLALTLNRPHALNAVTTDLVLRVVDLVEAAGERDDVRVVTLTGAGRAFCAGADLGAAGLGVADDGALPDASTLDSVNRLALAFREVPQLVVALVNGPAAGVGASFAMGADLVVASDAAYLKGGFDAIGLMPDGGATAYLVAALGRPRALAYAVLGDRVEADEALRLGLFARVWPAATFAEESAALVARLAAGPRHAYAAAKRAVDARGLPAFTDALETERREQRRLLGSADFAEGAAAFRERRRARFGD
ncbi:enoyl-CoA hydratase-related protein [Nocardioides sp. CFH 31398]|uniref:enoyl-CoA hydratase-related protein n=1 Tax=Nocardioides sp. CFH 31398 TaxID=2919579 RepID=UPI001F067202|nr:enoyl-CoA hydratase-related protein [Nocardioides sp. CFH 31398]MCH1868509.1 enoyl-CoA hydratase-related protein [Nocardioides sp. CFH 31398]